MIDMCRAKSNCVSQGFFDKPIPVFRCKGDSVEAGIIKRYSPETDEVIVTTKKGQKRWSVDDILGIVPFKRVRKYDEIKGEQLDTAAEWIARVEKDNDDLTIDNLALSEIVDEQQREIARLKAKQALAGYEPAPEVGERLNYAA